MASDFTDRTSGFKHLVFRLDGPRPQTYGSDVIIHTNLSAWADL